MSNRTRAWAIARTIASVCAALHFAGCFTMERAVIPYTGGSEHMLASNYGWYLFNVIPLACGNAREDRWTPWVLFRNDVTMDKIQRRFTGYAEEHGFEMHDLTYSTKASVMFDVPGMNLPLPVPYLLTYREIQLSGVLVPKEGERRVEGEDGEPCGAGGEEAAE